MSGTIAFTVTRCAAFGAAMFPRRTRANGAAIAAHVLRQFVRSARVQLSQLHPPLFEEDAVRTGTHVSGEFPRAAEEFARTPETGWAAVGVPRGSTRTTAGVLHTPPQALVVYPPIVALANALLAALNGLRLLAPAALLGDLTNMLDASLVKACRMLLEDFWEAQGAAAAFLWLLVPLVRKGLIESVHGSRDVPPSEALQEMMEKMGAWVNEAETQEAALSPLPPT